MAAFIKGFLLEDPRRLMGAQGVQLFLAAFGKHPGWDDHIEDIGLDTESLVAAKQNLYVNGIGRQIDSAAWDKLGEADALAAFKHSFVWDRGGQFLVGRLWSSSDGKGRTRYPMVVGCHCVQLPLAAAARKILPLLAQLELACKQVKTAPEVRAVIEKYLNQLRFSICDLGTDDVQESPALPDSESKVFDRFSQQEGLLRVMYQLRTHMTAFARGRFSPKADDASLRPQQIRLPAVAEQPLDSLLLWSRIFAAELDPASPRLFLVPDGEAWVDVIVGEPTHQEFFCLRATPKAVPLASEVPYKLDPEFRERTQKFLADFRAGKLPPPERPASALRGGTTTLTRRWFKSGKKWFGASLILLCAAAALLGWKVFNSDRKVAPVPLAPASAAVSTADSKVAPPKPTVVQTAAAIPVPSPAPEKEKPAAPPAPLVQTPVATSPPPPVAIVPAVEPTPISVAVPKPEPSPQTIQVALAPKVEVATAAEPPARPAQAREPPPKQNLTNSIGMELVWLTNGFWAGRYEVTQAEYAKVMGSNPSKYQGNPRFPVENITWHQALDFCKKLTAQDRETRTIPEAAYYTLPTERQWESFFGRARLEHAITSETVTRKSPEPVGSRHANQLGLFDVLGNVWEWCLEETTPATRPAKGAAFSSPRTLDFKPLSAATALNLTPQNKYPHTGFRCVLIPSE